MPTYTRLCCSSDLVLLHPCVLMTTWFFGLFSTSTTFAAMSTDTGAVVKPHPKSTWLLTMTALKICCDSQTSSSIFIFIFILLFIFPFKPEKHKHIYGHRRIIVAHLCSFAADGEAEQKKKRGKKGRVACERACRRNTATSAPTKTRSVIVTGHSFPPALRRSVKR